MNPLQDAGIHGTLGERVLGMIPRPMFVVGGTNTGELVCRSHRDELEVLSLRELSSPVLWGHRLGSPPLRLHRLRSLEIPGQWCRIPDVDEPPGDPGVHGGVDHGGIPDPGALWARVADVDSHLTTSPVDTWLQGVP